MRNGEKWLFVEDRMSRTLHTALTVTDVTDWPVLWDCISMSLLV